MFGKYKLSATEKQELSNWIYNHYHLHYRYGYLAYLIVNVFYFFIDYIYYPKFIDTIIVIRLMIGLPVLLFPVIISFTKHYKRHFLAVNFISSTISPVSLIVLIFILSQIDINLNPVYFGGLILQILIIGLLVYDWKFTFLSSFLVLMVFVLCGNFFFVNNLNQYFFEEVILLINVCLITTFIAYLYQEVKTKMLLSEKHLLREKQVIEKQNIELQKMNSSKNKLFSIIAHDLKAPLSAFLGLSKIMAEESKDLSPEEIQKFSSLINKSADNLTKLLDNLLNWSLLQMGAIGFCPEPLNLSTIFKENVDLLNESAIQKDIIIELRITDPIVVFADINMLNSVLRNLISNAIKFTHRGGKIEIGLMSRNGNRHREIYVKDSGIGINPQDIERLFNIETKISCPGTENEPSTGLGLVLCKEFVKKNGGKIWAESGIGTGSTFYFTVPVA